MTAKTDDLEAVRVLADTLQPFASEDRERIIRWAREKLGMATAPVAAALPRVDATTIQDAPDAATSSAPTAVDIKKFVNEKAPRTVPSCIISSTSRTTYSSPCSKDAGTTNPSTSSTE